MRISDWSSDVCSSDLPLLLVRRHRAARPARADGGLGPRHRLAAGRFLQPEHRRHLGVVVVEDLAQQVGGAFLRREAIEQRSEEHTSELQSLMRISYAVFCLKKKKINNTKDTH